MKNWRNDAPPKADWYTTDLDPSMRRYYDGASWSPPIHVDDLERLGPRVMLMLGEYQAVDWLPADDTDTGPVADLTGEFPLCPCPDRGECVASTQGRARGFMSTISDVRCRLSPKSLRYDAMERALRVIEKAALSSDVLEGAARDQLALVGRLAHNVLNT